MKWIRLCLASLVVCALMPASGASAETRSLASCSGTWKVSFSPGVGTTSRQSSFTTNGHTGTIICVGTVKGHLVTGPGTFGKEGVVEGSCLAGTGSGTMSVRVPTTGGVKQVEFSFTMVTGPGLGFKFGNALFGPLTFLFVPSAGDCIITPVTEITVLGQFALRT